jgi:hypothetical protein
MTKPRKESRMIKGVRYYTMGPLFDGSYIVHTDPNRVVAVRGMFTFKEAGETLKEGLTLEEANEYVNAL